VEKELKVQGREDLKYKRERIESTRKKGLKLQGRKDLKYKGERI